MSSDSRLARVPLNVRLSLCLGIKAAHAGLSFMTAKEVASLPSQINFLHDELWRRGSKVPTRIMLNIWDA